MSNYTTKFTGVKEVQKTGYQRDSQEDKTRYDLIPVEGLKRLADLYARGAKLYNEDNWKKGSSYKRIYASMLRHVYAWRQGDTSEDHLAAISWASMALMFYEDKNMKQLDDR